MDEWGQGSRNSNLNVYVDPTMMPNIYRAVIAMWRLSVFWIFRLATRAAMK